MIRAVIFDCDGVLVDSEPLHYEAFRRTLAGEGIPLTREAYFGDYFATASRDSTLLRMACESRGVPLDDAKLAKLVRAKTEIVDAGCDATPLLEPTFRFARAALAEGLRIGVASGERSSFVRGILARGGLLDRVEAVVGCEEVEFEKPHPGPYLEVLRRLNRGGAGLAPEECLVVEDSAVGCASGRAAGMWVVGLTTSVPPDGLASAHLVRRDLSGLEPSGLEVCLRGEEGSP